MTAEMFTDAEAPDLGQWFTPRWACEAIVEAGAAGVPGVQTRAGRALGGVGMNVEQFRAVMTELERAELSIRMLRQIATEVPLSEAERRNLGTLEHRRVELLAMEIGMEAMVIPRWWTAYFDGRPFVTVMSRSGKAIGCELLSPGFPVGGPWSDERTHEIAHAVRVARRRAEQSAMAL